MSAIPQAPSPTRAQVGRPRNPALDKAIFQAVRELLAEEGYQALSINKVTIRCGVHVRTIARRWDTKAELVAAAVLGGDDPLYTENPPNLPTGHLRADLRELVERNMQYLADPAIRAALPALWSEMYTREGIHERFRYRQEEWTATIRTVLERAVESGDAPRQVLTRVRILVSILAGSTFNLQFTGAASADEETSDELTDFLLDALLADRRSG